MTLPTEIVQFPLVSGVHEDVDPRTAKPGYLQRMLNCVWIKDGLVGRRYGLTQLPTTGGPSAGRRLMGRGAELLATDGASLFSYSPTTSSWVNTGKIPEVGVTWTDLVRPEEGLLSDAVAVLSTGEVIHAWVVIGTAYATSAGRGVLYWEKFDPATGGCTSGAAAILASEVEPHIRVLVSGSHFLILFKVGASIKYSYDGGAVATLRNDAITANGTLDAVLVGSNFFFVYENNSAGTANLTIVKASFASTPVVAGTSTITGSDKSGYLVGIDARSGENAWVAFGAAAGTDRACYVYACDQTNSLTQTLAKTQVEAHLANNHWMNVSVVRASATTAIVQTSVTNDTITNAEYHGRTRTRVVDTSGTLSAMRSTLGTQALSKPFAIGSSFYTFMSDSSQSLAMAPENPNAYPFAGSNSYLACVETSEVTYDTPHRIVGTIGILDAGVWTDEGDTSTKAGYLPLPVASPDGTEVWCPLPRLLDAALSPSYGFRQGSIFARVQSTANVSSDTWRSIVVENELVIAAGALFSYDGHRPFPYGFTRGPFMGALSGGSSGGFMVDGIYQYAALTEYESKTGLLYRSPVTTIRTVNVSSGGSNVCNVAIRGTPQALHCKDLTPVSVLINKTDKCFVAAYRTEVNGSVLHRLSSAYMLTTIEYPIQGYSITDTRGDNAILAAGSALTAQPPIYTDSEYDDQAPPAALSVVHHRSRIFLLSGDKRTVYYSKAYEDNVGVAPGFNPSEILTFDEDIVGMASMDDKIVFFSATSVWYTLGDGPSVSGDGSDYAVTRVQTTVGCTSARSIVATRDGIMFQSSYGWSLLKRNLEVDITIGYPVQDTFAAFPVITSAQVVANETQNHVRVTCNSSDGTTGRTLSFDVLRGQWAVFSYTLNGVSGAPIADAAVVNGVWYCILADGSVFKEDTSTWLDDGSAWATMDFETTEISGDGPLSYQRVRRAYLDGARYSDADVTISVASEASASYDQARPWKSDEIASIGSASIGIHVKNQKASSVRVRVTDAAPTGAGANIALGRGLSFSAIGFEIGKKQGIDKRPATARK
jgi:hypothetical protein